MDLALNNGFCEMTMDEITLTDGGIKIFGASVVGTASGILAGAAIGATIGGPVGLVVGGVAGCGVTYLYDHI